MPPAAKLFHCVSLLLTGAAAMSMPARAADVWVRFGAAFHAELDLAAAGGAAGEAGDDYILLFGSPVSPIPGPSRALLAGAGPAFFLLRRRRDAP